MKKENFDKVQGHWILAKMGKKVLRPGGRELTRKLIEELKISHKDDVVEFAPGIGFTASIVLSQQPHHYTGIDANDKAVAMLQGKFKQKNAAFVNGNAAHSGLEDNSQDKVYGEAMLTMHADHRKSEIIKEAYRILKPGGIYAIHELGITPDDLNTDTKATIQRDLAQTIRVNARPLTQSEWTALLAEQGFVVNQAYTNGMHLLHLGRMIQDEGFFRTLRIGYNILSNPSAARRISEMRRTFKKHEKYLNAIVLIAGKAKEAVMETKLKIIPAELEWTNGKVKGFAGKDLIKLSNGSLKLVKVDAGADYPVHQHPDKTEFAYVVSGTPEFKIGETSFRSESGNFFVFPQKEMHSIHNHSNDICELLVGAIKS